MSEKQFTMKVFEEESYPTTEFFCDGQMIDDENIIDLLNEQHETIKALEKQCTLLHMQSMFSTVKSFKGDLSKRYKYDEETDTIYDVANHYGGYLKMLDKKEITLLLNEYNTLLEDKND